MTTTRALAWDRSGRGNPKVVEARPTPPKPSPTCRRESPMIRLPRQRFSRTVGEIGRECLDFRVAQRAGDRLHRRLRSGTIAEGLERGHESFVSHYPKGWYRRGRT